MRTMLDARLGSLHITECYVTGCGRYTTPIGDGVSGLAEVQDLVEILTAENPVHPDGDS